MDECFPNTSTWEQQQWNKTKNQSYVVRKSEQGKKYSGREKKSIDGLAQARGRYSRSSG